MTRDRMMREIPAPELDDWFLLELVDPWGQTREDIRAAHQTLHLVAASGAKKTGGGAFTPEDFTLRFNIDEPPPAPAKEPQSLERMQMYLMKWAKAINKRFGKAANGIDDDPHPLDQ